MPWKILLTISHHHFNKEERESVGELSNVCSQIVLKCSYLARIGRREILWSVNKLARSVTDRTRDCDRLLARLMLHPSHEWSQTKCHVGNTAQHCRLGLFQDSDFAGDSEGSKSTSGEILRTRTSVSYSSTESEIITLAGGLRSDGSLALELRDVAIEMWHSSNYAQPTQKQLSRSPGKLTWCWSVVIFGSRGHKRKILLKVKRSCTFWGQWIEGRSPMMRHVSRTRSVALECFAWRNQLAPQDPNKIRWHQKPTCGHVNQRFAQHHEFPQCFLAAIFFRTGSKAQRRRKHRKGKSMDLRWRSQCRHVWFQETYT